MGTLLPRLPRVQRLEGEAPLESPQGVFPRLFCTSRLPEPASCSWAERRCEAPHGALGAGGGIRWKEKEPGGGGGGGSARLDTSSRLSAHLALQMPKQDLRVRPFPDHSRSQQPLLCSRTSRHRGALSLGGVAPLLGLGL